MTIKFNGVSLPRWVAVTGISFQTLPNLEIMEYKTPRGIGTVDGGVKRGSSTIKLKVMIEKDKLKNIHQQKDELKRWAMGDNWKPSKIIFDEEPDKYYMGRVSNSMEIDDLFTHGEAEVEFYCADPFKYSLNETVVSNIAGWTDVNNRGIETVPTIITIQLTKNLKNIRIENATTNTFTKLIGDFKNGQTITIDSDKKKVLINGVPTMKIVTFDSKWMYLQQGIQRLYLRTDTTATSNGFQVTYRQAD